MTYFTVFQGNVPWENCVDDLHNGEVWAEGHIYWSDRDKAEASLEHLKSCYPEEKFRLVTFVMMTPQPL